MTLNRVLQLLAFSLLVVAQNSDLEAAVTTYVTGNSGNVSPRLHGPFIHLAGGGGDNDAVYQEIIDRLRGCDDCDSKIDIVILRASGGNGYNDYLFAMKGVDSVETFVIKDRVSAARSDIVTAVRNAEYVFFAGGDQCNYVRTIMGSPIESAIREVYTRGGVIGGTSAGMAIQGAAIYDACNDASAKSSRALADPFNPEISFTNGFFDWRYLADVITDTHFAQRDRMGRLFAFIARQIREKPVSSFMGVGANEGTSVLIDSRGVAQVLGKGPAYFVLGDHFPEVALPGTPLTYCGFKLWRVPAGLAFDLVNRPRGGFYTVDVSEGKILSDPY